MNSRRKFLRHPERSRGIPWPTHKFRSGIPRLRYAPLGMTTNCTTARRSVNLPAPCFNQYNVAVLRPHPHSVRPDFARFIAQKFGHGPFLVISPEREELERQFEDAAAQAIVHASARELSSAFPENGSAPRADLAIWFYPPEKTDDEQTVGNLVQHANEVLLISGAGTEIARRRPQLVASFRRFGFLPDYGCDLGELEPTALRLSRKSDESGETLVPAVESAFARLNRHVGGLQRILRTRMSELDAADHHIAKLEEKLLKLKEAKRELKQLKQEKQALRKSPERKVGQILLAPYLLPQKLFREIRKRQERRKPAKQPHVVSPNEYQRWLERHRASPEQLRVMRDESRAFACPPLFSIITPCFNTPPRWLEEAVESVRAQAYENWELLLVDDGSTNPDLRQILPEMGGRDQRIVLIKMEQRAGISAASNQALAKARGDWIALLDHDDALEPDALFHFAKLLQQHPAADVIYSDEDKLTETGYDAPLFKPDWSPDFLMSCNYLGHLTAIRAEVVRKIGGFRSEFDFAQDFDLYLRAIDCSQRIHHIPRVLYHWRRSKNSTADTVRRKPETLEAGRRSVEAHLRRLGEPAHVAVDWQTHYYRVRRELRVEEKISIIIPVRDRMDLLTRCIDSITAKTEYANYEIVIVDNDSSSDEARAFFSETPHRVMHFAGPFNYSAMNNLAVEETDAPWLLFLNNDVEVINADWLTVMAEHVQRPEVGAVGARLLYPDGRIQHAGVVLGIGGVAEHAFRDLRSDDASVSRQLHVTRNYSAVTAACLLTRRDVFQSVGGFDEERLPVTFNDLDLCLKMRRAGYLIVYTPFAQLYHHESATRRTAVEPAEAEVIRQRWADVLECDPYYNPNLSRERADFSLGK